MGMSGFYIDDITSYSGGYSDEKGRQSLLYLALGFTGAHGSGRSNRLNAKIAKSVIHKRLSACFYGTHSQGGSNVTVSYDQLGWVG
jgi:hypothetical protein